MYYWVIQEIRGRINAIGPYRSSEAARNRMDKTIGGEVHLSEASRASRKRPSKISGTKGLGCYEQ